MAFLPPLFSLKTYSPSPPPLGPFPPPPSGSVIPLALSCSHLICGAVCLSIFCDLFTEQCSCVVSAKSVARVNASVLFIRNITPFFPLTFPPCLLPSLSLLSLVPTLLHFLCSPCSLLRVQRYRSQFQTYRWDTPLNSCASSECSDEDESDLSPVVSPPRHFSWLCGERSSYMCCSQECSKTSVFKVYNSSCSKINGDTPVVKGPNIFSWALRQQILHDHTYCRPSSVPPQIAIDHGTVTIKNIPW